MEAGSTRRRRLAWRPLFRLRTLRDGDFATVAGSYAGTAKDAQDTMEFSALTGVHPMIERYPLSRVAEAYERMLGGRMRFRGVLTFGV